MADLTAHQQPTVAAIFAAWEAGRSTERRGHLGASVLGRECKRQLWYGWRWAKLESFDGRMLRLFDRGHREEATMVAELRAAGVTVHDVDADGQQFRFLAVGGHVGGSMDGAAVGIKEAPKTWHVLEFKTHNLKSFDALAAKGVKKAKPEHWSQMQLYMGWSGMTRAFYLAACKNDDRLYSERVKFDQKAFDLLISKANEIVQAPSPPERVSEKPDFYLCRFCAFRDLCHGQQVADVTCRSCVHATPEMDSEGRWSCARWKHPSLTLSQQSEACDEHRFIPQLVPHSRVVEASEEHNWIRYETGEGISWRNGAPEEMSFSSRELVALDPVLIGDQKLEEMRRELGAEIVK